MGIWSSDSSEVTRNWVFFPHESKGGFETTVFKNQFLLWASPAILRAALGSERAWPRRRGEGRLSRPVPVSPVRTSPVKSLCDSPSPCPAPGPGRSPESPLPSWDPAGRDGGGVGWGGRTDTRTAVGVWWPFAALSEVAGATHTCRTDDPL